MLREIATGALFVMFTALALAQMSLPDYLPPSARKHTHDPEELLQNKAPEIVRERGTRNESQDLLVLLDDTEISRYSEQRLREKGMDRIDAEIIREQDRRLKLLKESIFPGGHLGSIRLLKDYPSVALVVVRVPNRAALLMLAAHPGVVSLTEIDRAIRPALRKGAAKQVIEELLPIAHFTQQS